MLTTRARATLRRAGAAAAGFSLAGALAAAGMLTPPMAAPAQASGVTSGHVQPAISKKKLRSAKVPAMCSNPAGRMKNGKLSNGIGGQWLRGNRIAIGTTKPGSKAGAAAAVGCSYPWNGGRGTVSEHIVFWDAKGNVIGNYSEGKLGWAPDTRKVWIKGKTTYVQVRNYTRGSECMMCGTGEALLQFRWSKSAKRMVLVKKTAYTEKSSAKALASALAKGKTATAKKYASAAIVTKLKAVRGSRINAISCWVDGDDAQKRYCDITYTKGGVKYFAGLQWQHVGWRHWKANRIWYQGRADASFGY